MFDYSKLFKNAHKEARQIVSEVGDYMVAFKIALTDQWKIIKGTKLDDNTIASLEKDGWSRWTKGNFDRLYFNADKNGVLDCDYYKSGNISSATWNGEGISNSQANRIKAVKCYMNVADGKITCTYYGADAEEADMLKEAAQASLDKAIA